MKLSFFILLTLLLISCSPTDTEMSFYPIEITVPDVNDRSIEETILVKNPPKGEKELQQMMLDYQEQNGVPMDSLIGSYTINFYTYNKETAYFRKRNEKRSWMGGVHYLSDLPEYYQGSVFYARCKEDTTAIEISVCTNETRGKSGSNYRLYILSLSDCPEGEEGMPAEYYLDVH